MRRSILFIVTVALCAGLATPARAALEAKLYVITDWISECSADDRPEWDDMADGWYNHVNDFGIFYKDGRWKNGNLSQSVFCDPNTGKSPCNDDAQPDDADAVMIALHGGDSGTHWIGSLRVKDANNSCFINGADGTSADELILGDLDAEFLHLSSCHSMDDDNITTAHFMFEDSTSASTGRRLHQVDGFHGLMWISDCRSDDYEDFALLAHILPIGLAWVDIMYDWNIGDDDVEQCPVAITVGNSLNSASTRMMETYILINTTDPSNNNYTYFVGIKNCLPADDDVFSDPYN